MSNESADVTFFRLTLRRLGIKSLALDSHLRRNLLSSFRSMTSDRQTEIIGEMLETSETLGELCVEFLSIHQSRSYSRTDSTTSPSCSAASE